VTGQSTPDTDAAWAALQRLPPTCLTEFPTPLRPLRRLGAELGLAELWCKRDDLIDFGLGGNKLRGLEFLLADAQAQGADTLVTGAGPQSNHVRATAAAIQRVARSEGILLDPVYTGKAMAGLLHHRKRGMLDGDCIVFLHTGGEPAFFAGHGSWLLPL